MRQEPTTLIWRPLTSGDAKAWADLLNVIETVDKTNENYDEEDAQSELDDPYVDLERASLAVFDGETMVGYVNAQWKPTAVDDHRVFLDGGVHPDYRRRGVGTRLLRAGVAGARELHALHHPTLKLVVDVQKGELIPGVKELMTAEGFRPARYFQDMEHSLGAAIPATGIPEGLAVEAWTPETDAEFFLIRNESFKDHWGSAPMTPDSWKNRITNHTFQPETTFLLRDVGTGAPAGMIVTLHWEADTAATGFRDAHFMLIGTMREYRKRGVAGALIAHALRAAAEQGFDKASLGVDSENPSGAFGVYERAGFVPKDRHVRWALEA
jgi:mycothiol synthase